MITSKEFFAGKAERRQVNSLWNQFFPAFRLAGKIVI